MIAERLNSNRRSLSLFNWTLPLLELQRLEAINYAYENGLYEVLKMLLPWTKRRIQWNDNDESYWII